MLELCDAAPDPRVAAVEVRRVLLHDAVEALIGGWDPITPLKPHLGKGFAEKNRVLGWLRGPCPSAGSHRRSVRLDGPDTTTVLRGL